MSRATVIPFGTYFVLVLLVLAAQERYGWSNEAISWPVLILIGATVVAHLLMKEREAAAKAGREAARADRSSEGAEGGAQPRPTRKASSST